MIRTKVTVKKNYKRIKFLKFAVHITVSAETKESLQETHGRNKYNFKMT